MRVCPACEARFESRAWRCSGCGHRPPDEGGFNVLLGDQELQAQASEESPFHVDTFRRLAAVEGSCFWFQGRNELIAWAVRRYLNGAEAFLEVGCGTGYVLTGLRDAFPDMRLVGGDYYASALPFARERLPAIELDQLDARELPFVSEFDAIGAFDVIEHIKEDEVALAEMHRSLRPGGGLLLTVPQHPWLWSDADDYGHHQRRYRRSELVEKVRRAGFQIERVTSFVSLLLPAMLGSRLIERRRKGEYDPMAELGLPRGLDRAMLGVLKVETAMIRAGISFPAGGSLLLVARRA